MDPQGTFNDAAQDGGAGEDGGHLDLGLNALDSATSPWDEACAAYVRATCARAQACAAFGFAQNLGTISNCESRYGGANCDRQMGSRGSTVTPAALSTCSEAMAAQSCADRYLGLPDSCDWRGTLADDAPCIYDQQCQSGRCDLSAATRCGSCKPRLRREEACPSSSARSCERGLVCADGDCTASAPDAGTCLGDVKWVCSTAVPLGGSCTGHFACVWGGTCINGRCLPGRKLGEACVGRLDCSPDQDSVCSPQANGDDSICVGIVRAELGESCDEGRGRYCYGGTRCKGADGKPASVGVCGALLEDGSACGSTAECRYPAVCSAGKCTRQAAAPESCQ